VIYVDDGFVTDEWSELADAELNAFNAAGYTIEVKAPKRFLGANTTLDGVDGATRSIVVSAKAYVQQRESLR
jgi:hypothetical protein